MNTPADRQIALDRLQTLQNRFDSADRELARLVYSLTGSAFAALIALGIFNKGKNNVSTR